MHRVRAAGAAITALIAASSAWGAARPDPGRYLANILVSEVRGAECPDRQGAVYEGVAQYGGLDATRVTIRIPVVFDGYSVIDLQVLTITSGRGTLKPRGSFSAHLSAPIDLGIRGSFEAGLALEDAELFRVRLIEVAPSIDCVEVFKIGLVRSG